MTTWNNTSVTPSDWITPSTPTSTWDQIINRQTGWASQAPSLVPHKIITPIGLLLSLTKIGVRWLPHTEEDWTNITNNQTAWR